MIFITDGQRLTESRNWAGLSQEQLALLAGLSPSTISRIERDITPLKTTSISTRRIMNLLMKAHQDQNEEAKQCLSSLDREGPLKCLAKFILQTLETSNK